MGSSWALVCSTAFILVLLSSAYEDEGIIEQREVTFDEIMQGIQQPESLMLQKEVDFTDLFSPDVWPVMDHTTVGVVLEFPIKQVMISPPELFERDFSRPEVLSPRGFRPRSFGPPMLNYPVQFPLGRPTSDNLQAICLHSDHRPRYPDSYFPVSGFGQLKRRASAVNKAESWFSTCCKGNQTWGRDVTLCCATQAWEQSVKSFCEEDTSVKDRVYKCCRLTGSNRLNCFHNDSSNPNYEPTEALPVPPPPSTANFNFDPNTCQRTVMIPYSVKGKRRGNSVTDIKSVVLEFPPGRPTSDAIESLCRNQKLRPLYTIKCLPGVGYEWLARQAKAINRIEKGFKQCCKKKQDVLNCADRKWREELNKFCLDEMNGEMVDFHCCSGDGANDRYSCFQYISPDPYYNMTFATEVLSLNKICDTHKIINKKFPVGFPLKKFVNQCCPLSEEDKTFCFAQRLKETSEKLCPSKASSPAAHRCCRLPSQEAPQCITKILLDALTKATNVLRQKKKKRCPVS